MFTQKKFAANVGGLQPEKTIHVPDAVGLKPDLPQATR